MHVDIIAGARPNFVKIASIIKAFEFRKAEGSSLRYSLIHTGQHYDQALSGSFFDQLNIPQPNFNLNVGSGVPSNQVSQIMAGYEGLLATREPNFCLVVGDVNSTVACTLVARYRGIPVAHVEGGIRSGDLSMPEELNRIVTDSVSNLFFTTSELAGENLRGCGVSADNIKFVGNTMVDTLLSNYDRLIPPDIWDEASLHEKKYFVLTLHRPSNVDHRDKLLELLYLIDELCSGYRVVFPMHPRTAKAISEGNSLFTNIVVTPALPYLEFNYLVKNSAAVLTDSGGITEEATIFGVPCVTLRDSTERPETISYGTNRLVGSCPIQLAEAISAIRKNRWKTSSRPPLWDGKAGARIAEILDTWPRT